SFSRFTVSVRMPSILFPHHLTVIRVPAALFRAAGSALTVTGSPCRSGFCALPAVSAHPLPAGSPLRKKIFQTFRLRQLIAVIFHIIKLHPLRILPGCSRRTIIKATAGAYALSLIVIKGRPAAFAFRHVL